MDLAEFYSQDFSEHVFAKGTEVGLGRHVQGFKRESVKMGSPEVVPTALLCHLLALNYSYFVDFDARGNPVMGEVGGNVIRDRSGRAFLGFAQNSFDRATNGMASFINLVQNSALGDNAAQLEDALGKPLEYRVVSKPGEKEKYVSVINGNKADHLYDFVTIAADSGADYLLSISPYLFGRLGNLVISDKRLNDEMYAFGIPYNEALFARLRGFDSDDIVGKLKFLGEIGDSLIAPRFVAGLHLKCARDSLHLTPLVAKKEEGYLSSRRISPSPSGFEQIGIFDLPSKFSPFLPDMLEGRLDPNA